MLGQHIGGMVTVVASVAVADKLHRIKVRQGKRRWSGTSLTTWAHTSRLSALASNRPRIHSLPKQDGETFSGQDLVLETTDEAGAE